MQIITMEEAKHQAVKEAQQRLGQDLHDSLSSSVASVKHQLEVLSLDTDNLDLKHKLTSLQAVVTDVYEATRNKSHEWFNAPGGQQEQSFEQAIKLVTDSALPDGRYIKDIHIDNDALLRVGVDIRIALLRVIQEAITNIIKHAKARKVGILIYEEVNRLIVAVCDDGKGLEDKKSSNGKSSMGLQSIRRRVQHLNGETIIRSGTIGTEIIVSIPLAILE